VTIMSPAGRKPRHPVLGRTITGVTMDEPEGFDVNDLDQLPDHDWFKDPPAWFRYFVWRLMASTDAGEVEDALEKISPWGESPAWSRRSAASDHGEE
jgi:hypothetical protein